MKNLHSFLIVFSIICLSSPIQGQEKSELNLLKNLDKYIENAVMEWKIPGLAIGVVKDSTVLFAKGFGYRDIENNLPVNENTLFSIGSCSKAFTSVSIGCLVDENKINLDQPIIKYVPSIKLFDNYVTNHITFRDMLSHKSGLPAHDFVWYGTNKTRAELFKCLQFLEPSKGFREAYQYSNLMYISLGQIVEQITMKKWEDYTTEKILQPLEMSSTNFTLNEIKLSSNYAKPYKTTNEKFEQIQFVNMDEFSPCGGIYSNVKDLSNWIIMNLNKGKFKGKQIVSSEFLHQALSTQTAQVDNSPGNDFFTAGYGLGWNIGNYKGHYYAEHAGGVDGYSAYISLLPADSIGVVVLINDKEKLILAPALCSYVIDKMLGFDEKDWAGIDLENIKKWKESLKEEKAETTNTKTSIPIRDLNDYVGKFEHPAYGTFNVLHSDSGLTANLKPLNFNLKHVEYDIFEINVTADSYNALAGDIEKTKIKFNYSIDGEIDKLLIKFPDSGNNPIEFVKTDE